MLLTKLTAVSHKKGKNPMCVQNVHVLNITASGLYNM